MKVTFKAKPQRIYNMDDTLHSERVKVPALKRSHVDMDAARQHQKLGAYANSDLFPSMLNRKARVALGGVEDFPMYIDINNPPANVSIAPRGPLVEVSFTI